MVIMSGNDQTAEVGTALPLPLVVRVTDSLGAPVARVMVRFLSSATFIGDSSLTDAQGLASIRWTLGERAMTQVIIAQATVYTTSASGTRTVEFTARATAGVPARVTFAGGDGSVAVPGNPVDTVVVLAADRFGNPSPGAAVTWAVTSGGGSIRPIVSATDTSGAAQAIWVLGPNEGTNTLEVTVGTFNSRATATASLTFAATSVVVGDFHSCALIASGAAYCWGENSSGQLGVRPIDDQVRATPQRVGGGLTFTLLAAGGSHTCGLTPAGKAYCWGNGRTGQLGTGVVGVNASPAPVVGTTTFISLTAGARHTCGLTSDRSVLCWGDNSMGQLGDNTVQTYGVPGGFSAQPVPIYPFEATSYRTITAGSFSTCGIATNGGTYCWGANSSRELGGDLPSRCFIIANQFFYDGTPQPCSTAPARLRITQELTTVAASGTGWCGVTTARDLLCWGNQFLQPTTVIGARVIKAWVIDDGVCGLDPNEAVTCWAVWGRDAFQVVRPFGDQVQLVDLVKRRAHACGVTRDARGGVYCWGENLRGQLGDGTTESRSLPVRVLSPRSN
jgi:alpha-tubulin suppressor-like RCC1 family protein